MATKREVMLAGVPAKLAHMLASDAPHVLAPRGNSQASATLIETNFQVLHGDAGTGVRLRPASGQFLHFLFNANFGPVAVYPDGNEWINDMPPGEPFILEALMSGVFAPARRQWIAGQLSGSGATGAGPTTIGGPFGVGITPPVDAAQGELFVPELILAFQTVGAAPEAARLDWNIYVDSSGVGRYLANGPGAGLSLLQNGELRLNILPVGVADAPIGAITQVAIFRPSGAVGFGLEPPADAQPGTIYASNALTLQSRRSITGANSTGHVTFNCYANQAETEWHYLADGSAFDFAFNADQQVAAMRFALPGTAGAPITWHTIARFSGFAGGPSGAVSALTDLALNWQYAANAAGGTDSVYIESGPAAAISFDYAAGPAAAMELWIAPPGAPGAVAGNWDICLALQHSSQLANAQTAMTLLWRDSTGAVRTTPVTVGAPDSAGTGFRQLRVPN